MKMTRRTNVASLRQLNEIDDKLDDIDKKILEESNKKVFAPHVMRIAYASHSLQKFQGKNCRPIRNLGV